MNQPTNQPDQETIRAAYDTACVYAQSYHPDPQVVAALLLIQELGPKLERIAAALEKWSPAP